MNHIKVEIDFIPVEDQLPDDYLMVYVIDGPTLYVSVGYRAHGEWEGSNIASPLSITHWAEIPEIE